MLYRPPKVWLNVTRAPGCAKSTVKLSRQTYHVGEIMNSTRFLAHMAAIFSALVLAACGTTTSDTGSAADSDRTPPAETTTTPEAESVPVEPEDDALSDQEATADGESVAVFVADFDEQEGWHPVALESGHLYINPEPVILRDDLTGIQAGKSEDNEGLLALSLSTAGQERVKDATTQYPNMRLALIVGNTLLAAPGYSDPVVNEHLIFAVGTEENAMAVARAIAGVDEDDPGEGGDRAPAEWN